MKTASKVYTALIFIFLYAPIIVLIIFSFNDTDTASRTQFSGFTLRWYQRLFEDRYILEALRAAILAKPRRHGFKDDIGDREVRRMNDIGG